MNGSKLKSIVAWIAIIVYVALHFLAPKASFGSEPIFKATGRYAPAMDTRLEALDQALERIEKKVLEPQPEESTVVPPKSNGKPTPISRETYDRYKPWYEIIDGVQHDTSKSHLINRHLLDPSQLKGLSQEQLNRLHGKMHGERPSPQSLAKNNHISPTPITSRPAAPPAPSMMVRGGCPGGVCPLNSGWGRRGGGRRGGGRRGR